MKDRLTEHTIQKGLIKPHVLNKKWVLCIGAGTSLPAFPTWKELVISLIKENNNSISQEAIDEIIGTFNYDALIQAACNQGDSSFSDKLQEKLYSKIRNKIPVNQWKSFCRAFVSPNATAENDAVWRDYISIRESILKETTAYGLGKLISDTYGTDYAPASIMSFNAETLLYSLINSFKREKTIDAPKLGRGEIINMMTLSIATPIKDRIPYYFCHGVMIDKLTTKSDIRFVGDSKLVFSEGQYLQMANNTFSWQSVTFLNACANSVIIFVGVSLSDPNMRKWLTWVQTERSKDINKVVNSTQHFWLTKKPIYSETMDWMEASVSHLGIRIVWIDEWNNAASVIKKMIGV